MSRDISVYSASWASQYSRTPRPVACDECYVRKVRCDRCSPCKACIAAKYPCTRIIKRKRKGPAKGSGSINSKLRARSESINSNGTAFEQATPNLPPSSELGPPHGLSSLDGVPAYIEHSKVSAPVDWNDGRSFPPPEPQTLEQAIWLDEGFPNVLNSDAANVAEAQWDSQTSSSQRQTKSSSFTTTVDITIPWPEPTGHSMALGAHALSQPVVLPQGIPLSTYDKYIEIYQQRLYPIWPIISSKELLASLRRDEFDYESYALAASLCAAVSAQLRLPEYQTESRHFEAEAQRLRLLFDYREKPRLNSLLTSFFLHVYYANTGKVITAGFYLRESIGFSYVLRLNETSKSATCTPEQHHNRIRVYWVLFVSERTYCVQNGAPITLQEIEELPESHSEDSSDSTLLSSFIGLTRLFTFVEFPLGQRPETVEDSATTKYQRGKLSSLQSKLEKSEVGSNINEVQKVDFHATRNWIRTLLWKYTISHYAISRHATDQAFSALLPTVVAKDILGPLSQMSPRSIRAHGYGMEVKVFQIADSLLDVMLCLPPTAGFERQHFSSRDVLSSLEQLLTMVGGGKSAFLNVLHERMGDLTLPIPPHIAPKISNYLKVSEDYQQRDGDASEAGSEQTALDAGYQRANNYGWMLAQ